MKIKSLQLKNFKRFTDLTLQGIPDDAKLVLLIGSNGSGKSSVFDAFGYLAHQNKQAQTVNQAYYTKIIDKPLEIILETYEHGVEEFSDGIWRSSTQLSGQNFYGRSSFRQVPRITRSQLGTGVNIESDSDRPNSFIERDQRFENDLEHIFGKLLREYFRSKDRGEIYEQVIDPINSALKRIFGDNSQTLLQLENLIPPLEGKIAEVTFHKGGLFFHYNYLSAGEKEVFNILVNLVARREYYSNSIYYFDEIDLHLNTKLQYNLLKELVENWIPEDCQFWTASHSLGFIEYATDYEKGYIFDFDDLDFDKPQAIKSKHKESLEVFEIAVSKAFIDKVVQGRKIIFSENKNTPFYNDLNIPNILFFVALDKNDVFHKAKNYKQFGIVDRDYLSDEEIAEIKKEYQFLFILPYYSFENLLYHPDNLAEHFSKFNKSFNKKEYVKKLTDLKDRERDYLSAGIIQARSGYPYYKENEKAKKLKTFKDNYKSIIELLRSDDFETYYKVFPAKDYGGELEERKNISPTELSKTQWFKNKVESIVK